ncbi:MAG: flippase-like domain-containing protein [Verrucomicrobia bacterium]|nr:flippase-like domain-containing protein [Verrucomicrobiota bacterium]MCF7707602.1 flippase-like domain-containing protein [Verrucomicrobiota bacterium]
MRKTWKFAWRILVCVVLLFWIFNVIFMNEAQAVWRNNGWDWSLLDFVGRMKQAWVLGPAGLWRTLNLVKPLAYVVSLLFMASTLVLGVIRWRMILGVQGLMLPWWRAMEISIIAHFFNSFLLGATGGDLLKAYYAARETHHKKAEAVITVFVDRLIGLFSMLAFACMMSMFNWGLIRKHPAMATVGVMVLLMLLGLTVVAFLSFWGGISAWLPRARSWIRKLPKGDLLERCIDACRCFGRTPSLLVKTMLISAVLNTACVLQVWVLAMGMGLEIPFMVLMAIVPIIICISAIPITPSGLGVRENLYVIMLGVGVIGVQSTHALALSLLAFSGSLFWSVIGGVVYVRLKDTQRLDEITAEDEVASQ